MGLQQSQIWSTMLQSLNSLSQNVAKLNTTPQPDPTTLEKGSTVRRTEQVAQTAVNRTAVSESNPHIFIYSSDGYYSQPKTNKLISPFISGKQNRGIRWRMWRSEQWIWSGIHSSYLFFVLLVTSVECTSQAGGKEIAQSLASLSTNRAIRVCTRLDLLVLERWNSITVLLTCSHQCRRLVKKRQSMCYYVCVIMHVKDP